MYIAWTDGVRRQHRRARARSYQPQPLPLHLPTPLRSTLTRTPQPSHGAHPSLPFRDQAIVHSPLIHHMILFACDSAKAAAAIPEGQLYGCLGIGGGPGCNTFYIGEMLMVHWRSVG